MTNYNLLTNHETYSGRMHTIHLNAQRPYSQNN